MKKNYFTLRIIGDIDWPMFEKFSEMIDLVPIKHKVLVELASDGGDASAAIAIAEKIRLLKLRGQRIDVIGYGSIASAAVIILASGSHRMMTRESWVMVHQDQVTFETATSTDLVKVESDHLQALDEQWCSMLAFYSGGRSTSERWVALHKNTTYLTAKQCLKLGLIDEEV